MIKEVKKNELGRDGEALACKFIEKNGFNIIKKNYRYQRTGEIDIIAKKDNLIVFIEVKCRNSPYYGGARYSITKRKKVTLKKIASQFLTTHPNFYLQDYTYRFDLISILDGKIEWIEDIVR